VVPAEDVAAVIHGDDGIERRLEHRAHPRLAGAYLFLGMASRDELADLAPEHTHGPEQPLIRLARLTGEELHHPDDAPRAVQREAEGRMQAAPPGDGCAREVPVFRRVDDPRGLPRLEHAAGQPLSLGKGDPLTQCFEFGRTLPGAPGTHTPQAFGDGIRLPDGAELPAERAADRVEDGGIHLDRPVAFGEDPGDRVLHTLKLARVSEPFPGSLHVRHGRH
jgi:hypothetical protein